MRKLNIWGARLLQVGNVPGSSMRPPTRIPSEEVWHENIDSAHSGAAATSPVVNMKTL